MSLLLSCRAYLAVLFLGLTLPIQAQIPHNQSPATTDSLHKFEKPVSAVPSVAKPWYQGKLIKATIVPAVLIGYGAYTFNGGGFYTNQEANRDIHRVFPTFRTRADDILIFAPYAELAAVILAGVESRDDRLNIGLVVLKSELIMLSTVFAVKNLSQETRPDGSDNLSFPSGHTAQAFLAASIVHTELRHKSQWYGVGAYTIATSVAALRMINNKHWQSDVVAGAGFGILSAHLGYLTHRNRWGRKPQLVGLSVAPAYFPGGTPGLTLGWRAH